MNLDQIHKLSPELYAIARKHGIKKIYVFGSMARGDSNQKSDVDFLLDMQEDASFFGVAGFVYEAQKLLGVPVDVIPSSLLPRVKDKEFIINLQKEARPL